MSGAAPARDAGRYGSMSGVPAVVHGWRGRTDPQRIELYTRWSFYGTLPLGPLLAVLMVGSAPVVEPVAVAPFLAGSVAVTVAAVLLARAGLAARPEGRPLPARLVATAVGLALATAVVGVLTFDTERDRAALCWSVALPLILVLVAGTTAWPARTLTFAAGASGALVGAGLAVTGTAPGQAIALALLYGVVIAGVVLSFRFTVWVLDVVEQLERGRTVQSQLAVAEERLRFARDLHDVMGRNLSAIAVKGQLAAELVRRGRPEAADELGDISRIAEQSLREVRGVVGGYRSTDLTSELTGARSVLRAAGVACSVTGEDDGAALPTQVQTALGWAVREAVTNVLRHSRATSCTIELHAATGTAELRVTNDGLPGTAAPGWGIGLTGLAERLTASGGRLSAGPAGGQFVLTATVPTEERS